MAVRFAGPPRPVAAARVLYIGIDIDIGPGVDGQRAAGGPDEAIVLTDPGVRGCTSTGRIPRQQVRQVHGAAERDAVPGGDLVRDDGETLIYQLAEEVGR